MTDETLSPAVVTESDREALWPLRMWFCESDPVRRHWDEGDYDEHPFMQLLARHRLASLASPERPVEREVVDKVLSTIQARKAIYQTKVDQANAAKRSEPQYDRAEYFAHTAEAMDILAHEIRELLEKKA